MYKVTFGPSNHETLLFDTLEDAFSYMASLRKVGVATYLSKEVN